MATLIGAIHHNNNDQLRQLLDEHPPLDKCNEALHFAIKCDKLIAMNLLLHYGANPYSRSSFSSKGTALHTAIYSTNLVIIETLLHRKMDPNDQDIDGNTPLHLVSDLRLCNRISILTKLMEYHADVNIKNNRGETPLYNAILDSDVASVKFLLDFGADPHIINNKNQTPLNVAEELLVDENPLFFDIDGARTIVHLLKNIPDLIKEPAQ
jgi:ankyrin repeat protein